MRDHAQGASSLSLDPQIGTLIVGFDDGVIHILSHDLSNHKNPKFYLFHVFKPHKDGFTSISFSADTKTMITTDNDKSMFLFSVLRVKGADRQITSKIIKVSPIGYIQLKSTISSIV